MKTKQLRDLNSEELTQKAKDLKKDLFGLNYQRRVGNLEKTARFRLLKRDIARILTILRERDMEDGRKAESTK